MGASSEIDNGVIAVNVVKCASEARFSGLVWLGSNPCTRAYVSSITPASPLKRVFYWARFHLTAKMRSRLRNARVDAVRALSGQTNESGSDCAHCHPACEAATGRPDPLNGLSADLSEGRLSTSLLTVGGHKGGDWLEPFTGKKGEHCLEKRE